MEIEEDKRRKSMDRKMSLESKGHNSNQSQNEGRKTKERKRSLEASANQATSGSQKLKTSSKKIKKKSSKTKSPKKLSAVKKKKGKQASKQANKKAKPPNHLSNMKNKSNIGDGSRFEEEPVATEQARNIRQGILKKETAQAGLMGHESRQSRDITTQKNSGIYSDDSESEVYLSGEEEVAEEDENQKEFAPIYGTEKKKVSSKSKIPKNRRMKLEFDTDGFLGGPDESGGSGQEAEGNVASDSSDSKDSKSMASEIEPDELLSKFSNQNAIPWELEATQFKAKPDPDEIPKINTELGLDSDPVDFFLLILDKKIIKDATAATNEYYRAKPFHKQCVRPHGRPWEDVQEYEMARFMGLLYLMGILKKSVLRDYWCIDPLVDTPCFRRIMTRDRFSEIANHFRLCEKSKINRKEPLYKILHFINQIIENSRKYYTPSRNLSLDESMISYKGRNRFKMYMPKKPTRFGFKAYVVADSCSGFALSWEMHAYTKGNPFSLKDTIMRLVAPYRDSGYNVYMDRFYTSLELLTDLSQQGIKACGTIFPPKLFMSEDVRRDIMTLNHLECKHFKAGDKRFAVLKDGCKFIHLLSTIHPSCSVEIMRTLRKRDKKRNPAAEALGIVKEKVIVPQMIADYNKYMGGVDRLDQCISTYCYAPRTLKWQMRVFYYFLDIAMFNSYVIYKKKHQELKNKNFLTHKDYRLEVIRSLIGINKFNKAKRNKHLIKAEVEELLKQPGCNLIWVPKPKECRVCSGSRNEYNKKIRTQYMCEPCQFPVCIRGCYDKHYRAAEAAKNEN